MRSMLLVVMILVASSRIACAGDLEPIQAAADAAKTSAAQFYSDGAPTPDPVLIGAAQEGAARQAADAVNSPQYQQKLLAEKERLQREVFGIITSPKTPYYSGVPKEGQTTHLAADERVYLFVSSSMPEATLRAYVQDIDRLKDPNIILVLRGFVGGMKEFKPTMQFITNLLKKDPRCEGAACVTHQVAFEIDPNLYRRFKPTQVPALVYARGVTVSGPGVTEGLDDKGSPLATNPWWMIYGDASLSYLLSRVSDDADSPVLAAFSAALNINF